MIFPVQANTVSSRYIYTFSALLLLPCLKN